MAVHTPNHDYLATEVLTAPPHKLRLMLIEAAIRYISRARASWAEGHIEQGGELILRAQDVVGELLAGLKPDAQSELVRNVAALYVFVFRALVDAHVYRNAARLEDALRVLSVEAETWRMVCRQLAESQLGATDATTSPRHVAGEGVPSGTAVAPPSAAGVPKAPDVPPRPAPVASPHVPPANGPHAPRAKTFGVDESTLDSGFSVTG